MEKRPSNIHLFYAHADTCTVSGAAWRSACTPEGAPPNRIPIDIEWVCCVWCDACKLLLGGETTMCTFWHCVDCLFLQTNRWHEYTFKPCAHNIHVSLSTAHVFGHHFTSLDARNMSNMSNMNNATAAAHLRLDWSAFGCFVCGFHCIWCPSNWSKFSSSLMDVVAGRSGIGNLGSFFTICRMQYLGQPNKLERTWQYRYKHIQLKQTHKLSEIDASHTTHSTEKGDQPTG